MSLLLNRQSAIILNGVIIAIYIAIAVAAPSPWIMLGGVLLVAVIIRCATFYLLANAAKGEGE